MERGGFRGEEQLIGHGFVGAGGGGSVVVGADVLEVSATDSTILGVVSPKTMHPSVTVPPCLAL